MTSALNKSFLLSLPDSRRLDIYDVARYRNCHLATVMRHVSYGTLTPLKKNGRQFIFKAGEVKRWLTAIPRLSPGRQEKETVTDFYPTKGDMSMASKTDLLNEIDVLVECLQCVQESLSDLDPESPSIEDDISALEEQVDEALSPYEEEGKDSSAAD